MEGAVTEQLETVHNKMILNQPENTSRLYSTKKDKRFCVILMLFKHLNSHSEAFECELHIFRA